MKANIKVKLSRPIGMTDLDSSCLVFPFSRTNANAISALLASLDIHERLSDLKVFLPRLKKIPEDLEDQVTSYDSIILAFSVYTTQLNLVSRLIEEYRDRLSDKQLLVVCGGPHAIGDPFSMLYNGADIVCTGEGEIVFRQIIGSFLDKKSFAGIDGVAYFDNNKNMIKTAKPAPLDLSKFPPFSTKHELVRPIEITRGCAWKCRFCQIRARGGSPVRHRPVDQILEYVEWTVDYFSNRRPDIRFVSPNALSYGSTDGRQLRLDRVEKMLSGIREIIGEEGKIYFGSFPSEVRPETITEESVQLLKKYSNVNKIILGGQSGSNKVLQQADRGHDVKETERAVELLLEAGFDVDVDIIFGLPGEEEEDIKQTKDHMRRLVDMGATIHSHSFLPLVGTPFANEEPGKIHPEYQDFITDLQNSRKLKGQHEQQEQQAGEIADRREEEREIKRIEFDTIRPD